MLFLFDVQVQINQCYFWLTFLQSRIPPVEPLGKHLYIYLSFIVYYLIIIYLSIHLSNNLYGYVYLGDEGKSHKPAFVLLVGTHADLSHARKNSSGEFSSPTQGVLKEKVIL